MQAVFSQQQRLYYVLMVGLLACGCVQRRFVVQTNVPAQIYVNNQPIGPSPADTAWEYTGEYELSAVAQGYAPTKERIKIKPKWYQYPGIDFFFEVLYPFNIEDVRRINLTLTPSNQVRTDELLDAASSLRSEAQTLPPPKYPDPVKR
jgi:PEGA domain